MSRGPTTAVFFSGVAVARTGFIAAVTVTGLLAEQITGSARLAGLPGAVGTLGTALGATVVATLIGRIGTRFGLTGGFVTAAAGAGLAVAAALASSFPLLLAGMFVLGTGHAATHLSRYAAAELEEPARRARAVGLIVWAGTIGSVVGPSLVDAAGRVVSRLGLSEFAGGFGLAMGFFGAAALLYAMLLPRPADTGDPVPADGGETHQLRDLFGIAQVQVALTAMVVGQIVMVLIMAMTPLHILDIGLGLGAVGFVISAHTLGMFALSPLTGWLTDRFGPVRVILAGVALLAGSSLLAAVAPADGRLVLTIALFLLGLGWNFGFVAGSALLTVAVPEGVRTALQGRADSIIWIAAAGASTASGFVLDLAGFTVLSAAGAVMALIPLAVIARRPLLSPEVAG